MQHKKCLSSVENVSFKLICNTNIEFLLFFSVCAPIFTTQTFFGDLFEKVGFKLICNIKNSHHQRKMWVLSLYATQKLHFERFFSLAPDFHYTNFIGDIFSKKWVKDVITLCCPCESPSLTLSNHIFKSYPKRRGAAIPPPRLRSEPCAKMGPTSLKKTAQKPIQERQQNPSKINPKLSQVVTRNDPTLG